MIKLQLKKLWIGNNKYFKEVKIEGLNKDQLPKEYLESSACAFKQDNDLFISDGEYQYLLKENILLKKNREFFEMLKHIRRCGDNLKKIKDKWSGMKTYTI